MNQKLIVLVGASGSGKSSFAKKYIKENPNTVRVNRDDMRRQVLGELTQDYYSKANNNTRNKLEKHITVVQNEMIRYWLQQGFDVIADNTHLRESDLDMYCLNFEYLADIYFKPIYAKKEVCKERILLREGNIDTGYIDRQIDQYKKVSKMFPEPEGIFLPKREVPKIEYDPDLNDCFIIDIDGTCADCTGIRSPYDGHLLHLDKPIEATRNILSMISESEALKFPQIIYVSGREDKWQNATVNWLAQNGFPYHNRIHMRKTGDTRKDTIVKKEIYEQYIKGHFNVIAALDDRKSVKSMWVNNGIFVMDVNQTDLIF